MAIKKLEEVHPNSTTETYALLHCEINNQRWSGVPIFFKTGKCLNYKSTEIHVIFKPISKKIIREQGFFESNRLIFVSLPIQDLRYG